MSIPYDALTLVALLTTPLVARLDPSSDIRWQTDHANKMNSYKWEFRRITLRPVPEPYHARDRFLCLDNLLIDTAYGAAASCGMALGHFVTDLFLEYETAYVAESGAGKRPELRLTLPHSPDRRQLCRCSPSRLCQGYPRPSRIRMQLDIVMIF